MVLLYEVNCKYDVGDTVKVEHGNALVEATVTAIVIEVRGEVNVFYELYSDEVELNYPLIIEEYLVRVSQSE